MWTWTEATELANRLNNNIEQLKGKILEFVTPEGFHLVEKIHQNSYKKSFDLTKKRHIRKFDELISKKKGTHSATRIADKKNVLLICLQDKWKPFFSRGVLTFELLLKHCLIKIS